MFFCFFYSNWNNQGLQGFKRKDQMDAKSKDDSNISLTLRLIMQGKVNIQSKIHVILEIFHTEKNYIKNLRCLLS